MPRPPKRTMEEMAPAMPMQSVIPSHTLMSSSVPGGGGHPVSMPAVSGVHQRVVDHDNFIRVRDSAVGRLTTILELLRCFIGDYMRQTNLLLGEHVEGAQVDFNAFENVAAQLMLPVQELGGMAPEKKQRKKRAHDPEAPKRPLTPYFLYMGTARPIIASDLGPDCPRGAVQEEGQRRWAAMDQHEKSGWNSAYLYNLRLYNARVHCYKQGNLNAKNMTDEEAFKYAEDFGIPLPVAKAITSHAETSVDDQNAIAEQLQQAISAGSSDEEDHGGVDMMKTPKRGGGGPGRKRKVATPAAEMDMSKQPANASPDKKRRRVSGKPADLEKEEPKKGGRKKTKSS